MSRRHLLVFPLVVLLALFFRTEQAEARALVEWVTAKPGEQRTPLDDDGIICVPDLVWRNPNACPDYGPATTAARIASVRLPDPLPELAVVPIAPSETSGVPRTYAQIIKDHTPVYRHPIEAAHGLPPTRRLGVGFIWVSVEGKTTYDGREYFRINANEYVPAEALNIYQPSTFQGVALAEQPANSFARILRGVQPLLAPGGDINPDAPVFQRYQLVQIFATEVLGDQVWYLIGQDQWINQTFVGKVTPSAVPAGVGPGAAWIDIDLFEQTLAAYVGDRMVYATLVSSGLPGWNTPPGLFQVWQRVESGKMSGAYQRPDYYFLEDVPWSLYFNRDIALHGAYWHDSFGYQHSHGCVNLAPLDARWLFAWATEAIWVRVQPGQELAAN